MAAPDSSGASDVRRLDPSGAYAKAGLLVRGAPLGFIGDVRFLGSGSADSTLVLVTLSLANRSLSFQPDGPAQSAEYGVILELRRRGDDSLAVRSESRETVRVGTPRETTASEPDIVFQRFVRVAPGSYDLTLTVRDEGGTNTGSLDAPVIVPRFTPGSLSAPISVYRAGSRRSPDSLPELVANPRATVMLGRDSLALVYVEGYGIPPSARLALTVSDEQRQPVLRDTVTFERHGMLSAAVVCLPISRIGVGRLAVTASLAASAEVASANEVSAPLLVSFGHQLGIMSFDEMLSRLRYYATPERLRALSEAAPADRAAVWMNFWRDTDPLLGTPEHEGLIAYFERIERAKRRFDLEGREGWLTDRGKVYVALGEPDRMLVEDELATGVSGRRQLWEYQEYGIRLVFVSDVGFDSWRLTPGSELDFQRALQRALSH